MLLDVVLSVVASLVVIWLVFSHLGTGVTWRTVASSVGFLTFVIAQVIIFGVERQRYAVTKVARSVPLADQLGI